MTTFGVVVFSLDGMRHVARCLNSVAWADTILLLHAGLSVPELGDKEFPTLSVRRLSSWGEGEKYWREIGTDWVLYLWGDECLTEELAAELRMLHSRGVAGRTKVYKLHVRSHLLGRWVEGSVCGPSPAARLVSGAEIPLGWWVKPSEAAVIARGWIEDCGTDLGSCVERVQAVSDLWAARLAATAEAPGALGAILTSLRVFIRLTVCNRIF